jgi:hypothetical protein
MKAFPPGYAIWQITMAGSLGSTGYFRHRFVFVSFWILTFLIWRMWKEEQLAVIIFIYGSIYFRLCLCLEWGIKIKYIYSQTGCSLASNIIAMQCCNIDLQNAQSKLRPLLTSCLSNFTLVPSFYCNIIKVNLFYEWRTVQDCNICHLCILISISTIF